MTKPTCFKVGKFCLTPSTINFSISLSLSLGDSKIQPQTSFVKTIIFAVINTRLRTNCLISGDTYTKVGQFENPLDCYHLKYLSRATLANLLWDLGQHFLLGSLPTKKQLNKVISYSFIVFWGPPKASKANCPPLPSWAALCLSHRNIRMHTPIISGGKEFRTVAGSEIVFLKQGFLKKFKIEV